MSQICISVVQSNATVEEIHTHNKKYLKRNFDLIIKDVENRMKYLPTTFESQKMEETIRLKNLSQDLLDAYTLSMAASSNQIEILTTIANRFSEAALNVKNKICLIKVEFNESKKKCDNASKKIDVLLNKLLEKKLVSEQNSIFIGFRENYKKVNEIQNQIDREKELFSLNEDLEKLFMDLNEEQGLLEEKVKKITDQLERFRQDQILEGYREEIKKISARISQVCSINDVIEKKEILQKLQKDIDLFIESHNLAQNLDLSKIKETKIKPQEKKQYTSKENEGIQKRIDDTYSYYSRIKELDPDESKRFDILINGISNSTPLQRLEMIRNSLMLNYGMIKEKITWDMVYREEILEIQKKILSFPNFEIQKKTILNVLSKKYIEKTDFQIIQSEFEEISALKQQEDLDRRNNAIIFKKLIGSLSELGYTLSINDKTNDNYLSKALEGKVVCLNTKWENYKVICTINAQGEILTRFVKVIGSEKEKENVSEYSRLKDIETGKKWCENFNEMVLDLQEKGIVLTNQLRIEPDGQPLQYLVDKNLSSKKDVKTQENLLSNQKIN